MKRSHLAFAFLAAAAAALSLSLAAPEARSGGLKDFQSSLKKLGAKKKKDKDAKPAPTCNATGSLAVCYSFTGPNNAQEKPSKGNEMGCKFMKGRYLASDTCPTGNLLGRCLVKGGAPEEYTVNYYTGGRFTRSKAEKDCKDPKSGLHAQGAGVWSNP